MDEMIVVAPRSHLFGTDDVHAFQGVCSDGAQARRILVALGGSVRLMRRGDAEEDPTYKQPIPYVALERVYHDGPREVFVYERLKGGGESRLHSKLSIGVGGHMNDLFDTVTRDAVFREEAKREIEEELQILPLVENLTIDTIGLINDDSDPVGQVHLGVLMRVGIPVTATVSVRETEQLKGGWMRLDDAMKPGTFERFENWSQLSLRALTDLAVFKS